MLDRANKQGTYTLVESCSIMTHLGNICKEVGAMIEKDKSKIISNTEK